MNRKSILKLTILCSLGLGIGIISNPVIVKANDSSPIVESSPIVSTPIEESSPVIENSSTIESSPIIESSQNSSITEESSPVISTSQTDSSIISESSEEKITYPCNIKLGSHKYGDILYDIEGGEIGDVVTLYVKPYSFYKIKSVKANGVELTPNADENYQFALIEGDNIVEAYFEIDDEQFAIIAELLANAKDGNWENIFSIENLFTIITWLISILMGSGFFVALLKSKKIELNTKMKTTEENKKESYEAFSKIIKDDILPLIDKIDTRSDETETVCKTLAKCFILSQEGTPESRIAIINELTNLQKTSKDLSSQVLEIINKEVEAKATAESEKKKALQELEDANSKIGTSTDETEGRI